MFVFLSIKESLAIVSKAELNTNNNVAKIIVNIDLVLLWNLCNQFNLTILLLTTAQLLLPILFVCLQ